MRNRAAIILALTAFLLPATVWAHHTVANTHDVSKVVTLTGVITSVRWQNPHVTYHLSVPGAVGVDWEIESRHLEGMRRAGVDKDTIRVGDRVTFDVLLALDGSHRAASASVVLADGRTVRLCTVTEDRCP
jgi:hypothetical protein